MPISHWAVVGVLDVDGVKHTSQGVVGNKPNRGLLTFFIFLFHLPVIVNGTCHCDLHLYNRDGTLSQLRWVFKVGDLAFIILEGGIGYLLQQFYYVVVVEDFWVLVTTGRCIVQG